MGYQFLTIRTEILDTNPIYGQDTYSGAFSKPTCAQLGQPPAAPSRPTPPAIAWRISCSALPNQINLGSYTVINLRQFVHSLYFQDDFRVSSKLTLNVGLRWEFASPLYERDNNYSNFDPTTNTMVKATGGSLFNRGLVHPDYRDCGPRLGLAYSIDPKTVVRGGYGISYTFFNRPGSAQEGINAPQALFGVLSQSIPAGGPVPATFLTTLNSFSTNIASPAAFNPANSNVVYTPPDSKWPLHTELVPLGAAAAPQEHGDRAVLQRKPQPAPADHRRLQPGVSQPAGPEPGSHGPRARSRLSGRSRGSTRRATITTTASRRAWSTVSRRACTC